MKNYGYFAHEPHFRKRKGVKVRAVFTLSEDPTFYSTVLVWVKREKAVSVKGVL